MRTLRYILTKSLRILYCLLAGIIVIFGVLFAYPFNIGRILGAIYLLSIGGITLLWFFNRAIPFGAYVFVVSVFILGSIFIIPPILFYLAFGIASAHQPTPLVDYLLLLLTLSLFLSLVVNDFIIIRKNKIETY